MPHPISDEEIFDISRITGNATDNTKRNLGDPGSFFQNRRPEEIRAPIFGESIQRRLKVTEISVNKKPEEDKKLEGRVVMELDVEEDMLNGGGNIHGGCSAFLVDVCSTLALAALSLESNGDLYPSVSQSLNIVYHSPAQMGDKLRLVNTTLTLGARAHSARTEIWNVTHHRLVVSGTHIKMAPSIQMSAL
ncbi:HotDog domain-containing protein [Crassisporium funariophilum]|nr:HotDog domain-containing protein [Crassisporium funariophilum]